MYVLTREHLKASARELRTLVSCVEIGHQTAVNLCLNALGVDSPNKAAAILDRRPLLIGVPDARVAGWVWNDWIRYHMSQLAAAGGLRPGRSQSDAASDSELDRAILWMGCRLARIPHQGGILYPVLSSSVLDDGRTVLHAVREPAMPADIEADRWDGASQRMADVFVAWGHPDMGGRNAANVYVDAARGRPLSSSGNPTGQGDLQRIQRRLQDLVLPNAGCGVSGFRLHGLAVVEAAAARGGLFVMVDGTARPLGTGEATSRVLAEVDHARAASASGSTTLSAEDRCVLYDYVEPLYSAGVKPVDAVRALAEDLTTAPAGSEPDLVLAVATIGARLNAGRFIEDALAGYVP